MRVAVVCPYDLGVPGGVQTQAISLARKLRASGEEAVLIGPGDTGPEGAVLVGSTRAIRGNRSVARVALSAGASAATREAAAHADVVHIHEPLMPRVAWGGLAAGRPSVATFHADPPSWVLLGYRMGAPSLRRRLSDSVITAVSQVAAAGPRRLGMETRIIPNGIDVEKYRSSGMRIPGRVFFLGRDETRKGLDVLLGAWPVVRAKFPTAELVATASRGAIDGVRFIGSVGEGTKLENLAQAQVLVAPNLGGESFGIVPLEGLAAGCAVIASDIPAFQAVVGQAGMIVSANSEEVAEALVTLFGDERRLFELQRQGRKRAADFDWSKVLPMYVDSYRQALAL